MTQLTLPRYVLESVITIVAFFSVIPPINLSINIKKLFINKYNNIPPICYVQNYDVITDRIMTRQTCCKYKSDIIYYIIQPECYIIFISPSLSATQEYTPDPVLTMTMIWFLLSHQNRYIASFDLDLKEFMWFVWAEVLHLSNWLIVKLSHRRRLLIWRINIKRF